MANKKLMKKILLLVGIMFIFYSCNNQDKVYICNGRYSKSYHKHPDCEGLRRCSTELEKITKQQAIDMGRKPCGYCY